MLQAINSGLVGAYVLTLIHESARRAIPDAPRMDILGMRAIDRSMRKLNLEPPSEDRLHTLALVGDIVSNSLYYSMVGSGRPEGAVVRGALLGLAAGVGAVVLPEHLGLGEKPSGRTEATKVMTVGWYVVGGIAAGLAFSLLSRKDRRNNHR
jgi:hypothetical protein